MRTRGKSNLRCRGRRSRPPTPRCGSITEEEWTSDGYAMEEQGRRVRKDADRREKKQAGRLRSWVVAQTVDQSCNFLIVALPIWLLGHAVLGATAESVVNKQNVMTGEEASFQAYDLSSLSRRRTSARRESLAKPLRRSSTCCFRRRRASPYRCGWWTSSFRP